MMENVYAIKTESLRRGRVMREMKKVSRRNVIRLGLAGTVLSMAGVTQSWGRTLLLPTPAEVEGPFYPVADQADKDADMTRIAGRTGMAKGEAIIIEGAVTDVSGKPVADAVIDIWQANAAGRYNHPRDPNPAPHDSDFQGWAVIRSDAKGHYQFITVKPGAYPATKTWIRPPHIHFKISGRGFQTLITQMYFPYEPLNKVDLLLRSKSTQQQSAMIARAEGKHENLTAYVYNIVLTPMAR